MRDVAEVSLGPDMRRGVAELDGEGETVGGIVIMRYGENALPVIDRVKERLEQVRAGLPEGVELVVTYDRSELIEAAIGTLKHTLHRGDDRRQHRHLSLLAPRAERADPHPDAAAGRAPRVHPHGLTRG